jgi:uncharacterized protein
MSEDKNPPVKEILAAYESLESNTTRGEAHIIAMSPEVENTLRDLSGAPKKSSYEQMLAFCKEAIPTPFHLGEEVYSPAGKGIIVHLGMEYNGLYLLPGRAQAIVWFGTERSGSIPGSGGTWVSRTFDLAELKKASPAAAEYSPKSKLLETFKRDKVFLPVIHPVTKEIALSSIKVAVEAGADGIFLIDQGMTSQEVLDFVPVVRGIYPHLWIGVNLLDTYAHDMIQRVKDLPIGGIWSDNAGILESSESQPEAQKFMEARMEHSWNGLYFGGVAFKYQRIVPYERLPFAAEKAMAWMDVITTSGQGTGQAAEGDKVKMMRWTGVDHPIALASGITPENVDTFLPDVDVFLVASGIETAKYSGVLIPERTKDLADKIHNYKA